MLRLAVPVRALGATVCAATRALALTMRRTPVRNWPTIPFGIGAAALLIAVAFITSAAFGVLRQILFNWRFGIGEEAAALYAALRLAETLSTLVAGGALANALLPGLIRLLPHGQADLNRLVGRLFVLVMSVLVPLFTLTVVAAPWLVQLIAPGLSPATQQTATLLARILASEVLLIATEGLLSAVLIARRWFFLPALGIVLRNSVIITSLLLPQSSIVTVAVASLGDSVVQLLVLLPGLSAAGFHLRPTWAPRDRDVRLTLRLFTPASLSALANYSGTTVDTALATIGGAAAGLGAVSNAWLLAGLPIRLLGTAPAQAALPRITALALHDRPLLRRRIRQLLAAAVGLSLPVVAAYLLIGGPLVSVVFERGAFDRSAAQLTAAALVAYAPALPAAVATELLTRILLAYHDTRSALLANLLQQFVRISTAVALLPSVGALAVPIAFSISAFAECLLLAWLTSRHMRNDVQGL